MNMAVMTTELSQCNLVLHQRLQRWNSTAPSNRTSRQPADLIPCLLCSGVVIAMFGASFIEDFKHEHNEIVDWAHLSIRCHRHRLTAECSGSDGVRQF